MAVIKGVNAMQTKEIAIIKNKASKSYTEFNTNIEILIPNIRVGKKVGKIKIESNR